PTPNAQRSTLNAQRSTLNAQRSTLNAQRSTLNAQRSTLNLPVTAAQPQSLQPRSGKVIEAPARSSVMRLRVAEHRFPSGCLMCDAC
ncbi:MAG: hypothetical protein WCZ18_13160, partial [Ottowia sp.]